MVDIKLYSDFCAHLETKINEKWYWDQESQSKTQGLFSPCRRFDRLLAFAVLFNRLELVKPPLIKLQKRNRDIYHAYHMTGHVISDLNDTKRDIENEFQGWSKFTTDMAASVDVDPETSRTTKCCRCFREAGLQATLLKKRLWHRCFLRNFAKFLRTPFLQNTSGRLLLVLWITRLVLTVRVTTVDWLLVL